MSTTRERRWQSATTVPSSTPAEDNNLLASTRVLLSGVSAPGEASFEGICEVGLEKKLE